jgi:hypothetical protein
VNKNYYTQKDKDAEDIVAKKLENHFGLKLVKMSDTYVLDYLMVDSKNEVKAFIEVKVRYKYYPDPFITSVKYWSLRNVRKMSGIPVLVAMSFPEKGIYYKDLDGTETIKYIVGGRVDRNDINDWESQTVFDLKEFTKINE